MQNKIKILKILKRKIFFLFENKYFIIGKYGVCMGIQSIEDDGKINFHSPVKIITPLF